MLHKTKCKQKKTNELCLTVMILAMFLYFSPNTFGQKQHQGKVLLAVFAHPDDESTVAPILAKYQREGAKVHIVIVTDGRYGTNSYHDHKAGDELVATRNEEMKCAAIQLGASLTHLNYHDQLKTGEGYDGHVPLAREMTLKLFKIVENTKPDVILTWGPDGGSTHMDHRLVGASITQAYLSKEWEKPISLFFYGTPVESIEDPEDKILRGQVSKYLTTKVSYAEEDLDRAFNSLKCHYSQIDPKMTKLTYKERKTRTGMFVYLRKIVAPNKYSNSIFE